MRPEIETLATLLDEAEALLRTYEHFQWADWLSKDARRIRNLDFYGVEHLLSAYGGMGSFNDIILHTTTQDDKHLTETHVEERFDMLRSQIYSLAKKFQNEEI